MAFECILFARPISSLAAAKRSRTPKRNVSQRLLAWFWSRAPVNPPAALVSPKRTSTLRSTLPERSQNRRAVPATCGIDTAATASRVSISRARSGVKRLPIPKPVTAASAPARAAITSTAASNHINQQS
jgi:hypothetical protein